MATAPRSDRTERLNAHRCGFDRAMGLRFVRASADEVVAEYEIGPQHRQPYGIVHGGVHCAAVETVCSTGASLSSTAHGGGPVVGIENHTSFIRAARQGRLRVSATPVTRGRRSQVWEATIRDEEGRTIATGRVRLLCLEAGADLAGEPVGVRGDPLVSDA